MNGLSSSENAWLLTTVLREEWGFQGLVVITGRRFFADTREFIQTG